MQGGLPGLPLTAKVTTSDMPIVIACLVERVVLTLLLAPSLAAPLASFDGAATAGRVPTADIGVVS